MRQVRRSFLLLCSVMAFVALVVAACGGDEEPAPVPTQAPTATRPPAATAAPTPTPAPPTATPAPAVKRGRILRTRVEFPPTASSHWDLLRGPINSAYPLFQPVLSSLIQLDLETERIVGDLAESWTFSGDGKQITFKVRQGVTWHDGAPMKAADLKSNVDAMIKRTLGYTSHFEALLGAADNTEALDDATLRLSLKRPSNSLFRTLTHGLMLNYAPHVSRDDLYKGKVVGTNAYIWARNDATKIEERRYPGYWDKGVDGRPLPYLDGIDFTVIADTALHLAAFRTGQIDAFGPHAGFPFDQLESTKKDIPNLVTFNSLDSWRMVMFKNRAPFTNAAVRRALQIATDRVAFVGAGLRGAGTPAGFVMSPKGFGGAWGPTLEDQQKLPGINPRTRVQDVAEAERLMASAGFTAASPFKVSLHVVASGGFPDEAVAWSSQINKELKSIQIEVKSEESAIHNRRLVVPGGDFDLIYRPFGQALDDPSQTAGLFWISSGSRNYGEWKDAQVDQWYEEQESTTNEARRVELINLIQQRLWDEAYNLVLGWAAVTWVKRPELKGAPLGGAFANRNRFDRAWLDR